MRTSRHCISDIRRSQSVTPAQGFGKCRTALKTYIGCNGCDRLLCIQEGVNDRVHACVLDVFRRCQSRC